MGTAGRGCGVGGVGLLRSWLEEGVKVKLIAALLAGAALLLHTGPLLAHVDVCSPPVSTPTAIEIAVSSVPIQVSSTTSDYFVLYAHVGGRDFPVQVKRGESGTTTLKENIKALPASDYRVEKYSVADPADVDGDCLDDLADPAPVNHSHRVALDAVDGAMMIADHAQFEEYANEGVVKFVLVEIESSTPAVYFQNTNTYESHYLFINHLGEEFRRVFVYKGALQYHSDILLNGDAGVYNYEVLGALDSSEIERVHTLLAAHLPMVDHDLAFSPSYGIPLPSDWVHLEEPRVPVLEDGIVFRNVNFSSLNAGEGFGRLQALEPDDRPNPRDIVLYETLPNELSRVAGIISTQPQTPLSHVDLRAKQNRIPNAFIRDAQDDAEISSLLGQYVYFQVTEDGFEIRAATKAEVDAHYESLRPRARQTPERDLSVQAITPLSAIGFEDYDAFGVKAANVAELAKLGFPEGTTPDGFAIPFYFYDEFMKHNGFYDEVDDLLADEDFLTDFDEQEKELKKLRKKIKDGESPDWMIDALEAMHDTYPWRQSLRYRSSTNNEDLPNFSGAGLYDSNTQKPDETEDDGIDKSMKQVFASLWNFRAFVEREFYRIDHTETAMGILVHPNYTYETVNGVAVSFDPLYGKDDNHYVNSQRGEDLVTNPDAYSLPEELQLRPDGSYGVLHYTNQLPAQQLLMSDSQLRQLRRHLDTIHDHFDGLYDIDPYAIEIEFKITSADELAIKQARPWVFNDVEGDAPTPPPPSTDRSPTPMRQAAPTSPPSGGGGGGFGPAPVAPSFTDGFRTTRGVAENARNGDTVGEPVPATHPDELAITYSLSGADAASFTVDEETGQIRVKEGVELVVGNTYTVNLTATDSAGFGAIIIVTIEVAEASLHRYDLDGNGRIERDEVIAAIGDYFAGLIQKDGVIEVVKLYFSG